MNATLNTSASLDTQTLSNMESPTGDTRADQSLAMLMSLTEEQRRFYAHFNWVGQETKPQ